ncbi:MAG: hypothetical protein EBY50_06645, partial [Rhodobacteraceae bacterium]|nr:hypothetical protein [Paracoccaceae bacterium]
KRQYIEWQDRGTSTGAPVAIHEAGSDIINQIYDSTGMKIKLINGIKEAKLIAKGNPIKKLDFDIGFCSELD